MKFFYFPFIVFLMLSCKPDHIISDLEKGMINGVVIDYTNNAGVPHATVYLLGNDGGGTWVGGGTPSFFIDQTTADENGNFTFQIEYDKEIGYLCTAVADFYFDYNDEFSVDRYSAGGVNVEVKLQPKAWLKLRIKAVNSYDASDYISINSTPSHTFYGEVDTTQILSVWGNADYHLVWFIYENGINDGSETADVFTPAFDTTYFEILY